MKKTLVKIKNVLMTVIMIFAILMSVFTVISSFTFNKTDRSLFGYKFYVCLSDSMKATDFEAGDLVISKKVELEELKEGDIISFVSTSQESNGEVITHKIRSINKQGNLYYFNTYGTTTGVDDATAVEGVNVLGKYQFSLPKVGLFFDFVKTTPGYICCIFVPFMVLIVLQIINTVSIFRQYKQQEMDQIKAEREEIEKQRQENEAMMKQINELKSKVNNSNN